MRTSHDVIDRIKWDITEYPTSSECIIGYRDFDQVAEMAFNDWLPISEGGDIPEHRIIYFKLNGKIIWDREKRIDLVFNST